MKKIIITCNHLETSESITTFVNSKFGRLFPHYGDIIRIRIELNLDSGGAHEKRFLARAIIKQRGPDIVAASESENPYTALGATLRKAERQLRRRVRLARFKREQIFSRMRRSARIPAELRKLTTA
ncbi:ribosome-associated translation inhibitor RaiA [Pelagicoccus sp. SDUM812002]|uniref:ribosome hibernation-promoting factor, HPF/YfiA family n=1 Tax=Pelagicoccus sp. SDUM812002 TaxID=3041266 RepID=UPI00280F206F|nr:ribosome-associated translation inhibitor RaiA [Pelagicoccus sp. SDUM812002]MDQ8184600.1 ribosome-associated translation inhibitor RaiA [Pelagicoccus sp. SDUM812002]